MISTFFNAVDAVIVRLHYRHTVRSPHVAYTRTAECSNRCNSSSKSNASFA